MTTITEQAPDSIRIRESTDAEKSIVLHPEDDDLFVRTGRQVIDACRLDISVELWQHEVRAMFEHVREWVAARADKVRFCVANPRPAKIVLFVAPAEPHFDFGLADDMAELNRTLYRNFRVGTVELLQIPADEVDTFVSEAQAFPLYGDPYGQP